MKTIYKYTLGSSNTIIEIPSDKILSCESQDNNIVVYALVDTDDLELRKYTFEVIGTGHAIYFDLSIYTFLNTIKMKNDTLMLHVFYAKYK